MIGRSFLATALIALAAGPPGAGAAGSPGDARVDGPFTHRNLSIYVVSGKAADGRRFVTLDEGLRTGKVAVREQGAGSGADRSQVNQLEVENTSDQWLYLQAGDVVTGGKQDRTIATDVAIPPHSAPQPIAAFCVEHGRWTAKAASGMAFAGSPAIVGSNELKKSIQEDKNQQKVWAEVARQDSRAAAQVTVSGEAPAATLSSTGTYRAIVENPRIGASREEYVKALLPRVEKTADAVGLVVAINGRITAADVYGSPELFRKLARKLLESYAQEAALAGESAQAAPTVGAARAFLRDLPASHAEEKVGDSVYRTTRKSEGAVVFEYGQETGETSSRTLLHRNYVRN